MTLLKQITLSVSILLLVLMLALLASDFSRAGRLQQARLQNTAMEKGKTLGAAIGNLPASDFIGNAEALIGAAVDSVYLQRIEFAAADGRSIERETDPAASEAPAWFIKVMPLQAEQFSTPVERDGTVLGQLSIEVQPGHAYGMLYQELAGRLLWMLLLFGAAILSAWWLLRRLLNPLYRLQLQADAINRNQFQEAEFDPPTSELKSIVAALNLMIVRVQGIFEEQERTLTRYRQLLYRDKITNLGNRRYLLEQLQQSMSEESYLFSCMAIIKILDYEQLRDQHGYESCNKLVKIIAELLRKGHAGHSASRLSRFNEDEFAFLSSADGEAAIEFSNALFEEFRQQISAIPELAGTRLVAGICNLQADDELGQILSRVDYCLSQACIRGPFATELQIATNLDLPQGKMQWRSWLESVIKSRELFLVGQLAISNERIPIQRELFVRARRGQDQIVPAAAFIPMAASLGMSLDIDREVIRLIREHPDLDRRIPLAINLSAAFFELAEAQEDFNRLLGECEQNDTRLCIEASHTALSRYPVMCGQVSEKIHRHGQSFGIDNLDFSQPLQLLQSGQFDYVKVNARVLHEMIRNDMTASYQALRTLGDTLDIRIIAVAVDSQEVYNDLRDLGIANMQGNFLGAPEII